MMTPKAYPNNDYTGCCLKGLTLPQRTYSANRIKYPMKRAGERGEDKWERITWDEAIATIAEKFMETQKTYGDQAIVIDSGSGNYGLVNGVQGLVNRFAYVLGATKVNSSYDQAFGYGTDRAVGGGVWLHGSETVHYYNSKVVFVWGSNPVHAQPQNWRILAKAQKMGTKLVCIDPIKSATASKCDEYIPIQPGTDLLLTMAMMRIIIENGWTDQAFMKARTTSPILVRKGNGMYLKKSDFTALAEGEEEEFYVWDADANAAGFSSACANPALEGVYTVEGIECEPAYALLKARVMETDIDYTAEKTGIAKDQIVALADLYAHSGASGIYTTYGIDHYQNGHLWGFALACMASITGNIGKKGCSLSALFVNSSITFDYATMYAGGSNGKYPNGVIPQNAMGQVFRDQALFGKPFPVRAMYTSCSNSMSNFAEQNQWFTDILPNLDFWVVADFEMTDCCRYADIVLPAAFWLEVNDLRSNYNNPYLTYQEKAIDPLYEKYPLVYIQDHSRFRSHSQWFNVPVLRELDPEPYIRMNPDDAAAQDVQLSAMRTEYTGLFLVPKKEKVFIFESRFLYPKDANPKDYMMFVSPCAPKPFTRRTPPSGWPTSVRSLKKRRSCPSTA